MKQGDRASYRQIVKATSLFGGVQVFNVLIQIVRSKVVAILLGPNGMGLMGLLNSTIEIVNRFTNFGLQTSSVKDISIANKSGNFNRVSVVVSTVRRLVWITGIIGAIICVFFSGSLSRLTFGTEEYKVSFFWLSSALLFKQLAFGKLAIIQGMHKLKLLAKANLLGSFAGLIITLPLYYILGIDGIVPGIIGTAFISMAISVFFARKIKIPRATITLNDTYNEGKEMLKMGFMLSLGGLFTTANFYILRVYIGRYGNIDQVGLYNAGFAIINTYVSLIFNAMVTDYYPRLSAVANDTIKCNRTVNQQATIAILILAPILTIFISFIDEIIIVLYSKEFSLISNMLYWAALGMVFKATSWSMGILFLAKGASKLYFWNELFTNIYILGFNILGYYFWGLTGLGISFVLSYVFHVVQLFFVNKSFFGFLFDSEFRKIFVIQFLMVFLSFLSVSLLQKPYNYLAGTMLIVLSGTFSFFELNKRIGLKNFLKKNLKNK